MNLHERDQNTFKNRLHQICTDLPSFASAYVKSMKIQYNTRYKYALVIRTYLEYILEFIPDCSSIRSLYPEALEELTFPQVESYFSYLRKPSPQKKASSSKHMQFHAHTLLRFYDHLNDLGYVTKNPFRKIQIPDDDKKTATLPSAYKMGFYFTCVLGGDLTLQDDTLFELITRYSEQIQTGARQEEIQVTETQISSRIAAYIEQKPNRRIAIHEQIKLRDFAIVALLLSIGLKTSQLEALDLSDFQESEKTLSLPNGMIVKLADETFRILSYYLHHGRDRLFPPLTPATIKMQTEALFLSIQGKRISSRSIQRMIRDYSRLCSGMEDKKITAGAIRSALLWDAYARSGNSEAVAQQMGVCNAYIANSFRQ